MKHVLMTVGLLCSFACASAQLVHVQDVRRVALPEGISAERAEISPDASLVVISSLTDNALRTVRLADGAVSTLTPNGEIFQLQFTPDSRRVVYRSSRLEQGHRRFTSVECADLATGRTTQVAAPSRRLYGVKVDGGSVRSLRGEALDRSIISPEKADEAPMASVRLGELVVTRGDRTVAINPQGREGMSYLWPSVSPDGTKVVYVLAGYGCYVCDIDGSNPVRLGDFRAPRWLGNDLVVGMRDADNGYVFTESAILVCDLKGRTQTLTDPSVIAMNPSVDASGSHIAFSTPDGRLYIITLTR